MNELAKEIENKERELDTLREQFDALDANHANQQVICAQDIAVCATEFECLKRFQKKMRDRGEV